MGKNWTGINTENFSFDVILMPKWRLWFWWRDWNLHKLPRWKRRFWIGSWRIQPGEITKQRLWKLQIGPLMFVYWHKK